MTDIEKLKELEAKATRGRWKVFATEREFVGGHTRQVYQIRTEKRHPQLKDHYPVVCECEQNLKDGQKHGIWLSKDDSAFIVAVRNALPALLASLASKEGEIERLKVENAEAIATGWRDIASAPKDGSTIMLCVEGRSESVAGFWAGKWMQWLTTKKDVPGSQPTHWQPLPEPPK